MIIRIFINRSPKFNVLLNRSRRLFGDVKSFYSTFVTASLDSTVQQFSNVFMRNMNKATQLVNQHSVAEFCQKESLFKAYTATQSTMNNNSTGIHDASKQKNAVFSAAQNESVDFDAFVFLLFALSSKVRVIATV